MLTHACLAEAGTGLVLGRSSRGRSQHQYQHQTERILSTSHPARYVTFDAWPPPAGSQKTNAGNASIAREVCPPACRRLACCSRTAHLSPPDSPRAVREDKSKVAINRLWHKLLATPVKLYIKSGTLGPARPGQTHDISAHLSDVSLPITNAATFPDLPAPDTVICSSAAYTSSPATTLFAAAPSLSLVGSRHPLPGRPLYELGVPLQRCATES